MLPLTRQKAVLLAKWSVSIGLIIWILQRADLNTALRAVKQTDPLMLLAALATMAFGLLVRAHKWQMLLEVQGAQVSLTRLHSVTYMSMFFNNFFLGSLGGDAFRFYKAIRYCDTKGGAASTVIMERATGFFMALFMVLVFGLVTVVTQREWVSTTMLVALTLVAIGAGVVMVIIVKLRWFLTHVPMLRRMELITGLANELSTSMRAYATHRKAMFFALILSLVFHVTQTVTVYCFTVAANADVSFVTLLFIAPLVGLLVIIPISMNGLGIQEGSYVVYLEQLGVAGPSALLVAILARLAILFFSLVGGLLFVLQRSGGHETGVQAR
jgi:uncharacterized protein (TIRG00374 family)